MKVCHILICCFFLSLQDGNTGLINAQTIVYTGTEGGDVTIQCSSSSLSSRSRKFFCKEQCEQKDILIETTDVRAQEGRYSIEWIRGGTVSVTITQLTKSDSGLYRCGWGTSGSYKTTYKQIEIIVVDALLNEDSSEEKTLYKKTGEDMIVACYFTSSENRKYFCKDDCKDRLVETNGSTGKKDRYSIKYLEGIPLGGFLYVSITQLTKSDSGRYGCGLERFVLSDPYQEFRIIVTDAPTTSIPNLVFSSSVPSASTATSSSSGSSTLPSASPETTEKPETTRDVLLYVGLTLVLMVILSLSVLICYRKRTSKPKDPPVETQYAYVTETNQVYENIREDRHSGTSPDEIPSDYDYVKLPEPNGAETGDDYSVVTAVGSQNTVEDDSSGLTYSQVDFSKRAISSSNSALHSDANNVVYSVPRV